ncbi:MAG: hypothetical protein AAGB15_14680 [Pseudomonadota bacterium]
MDDLNQPKPSAGRIQQTFKRVETWVIGAAAAGMGVLVSLGFDVSSLCGG